MSPDRKKREIRLQGIGVSPGIAKGEASVLEGGDHPVPRYRIAPYDVEEEAARLHQALEKTREELRGIRERLADGVGEEHLFILDAHLLILQDDLLVGATVEGVRRNRWNAEAALDDTLADLQARFSKMDSEYLRDRQHDVRQLVRHIQRNLMGVPTSVAPPKGSPVIVAARELTVADLLRLNPKQVLGFVAQLGGRTSHSGIIAGALGFPGVLGVPEATDHIRQGDTVVVDGRSGLVIVRPAAKTLKEVEKLQRSYDDRQRALRRLRDLPCETRDGVQVTLRANIGSPRELAALHTHGAKGIGLYRTEYLFLNRNDLPGEEEQFRVYREVVEGVSPEPVDFRTFDLGGDVAARTLGASEEPNPALGLRAIRLALAHQDVLRTQLRALLRASAHGRLRILHPFISGLEEVRRADALLREVISELAAEGIAPENAPPVGIMVETPSAALLADVLAREADFFIIGTNDLVQYTLAADRGNERVAQLYDPLHPAVLRLIRGVRQAALEADIGVSVCGEMAGDPASAALLVGMGIRELSMSPQRIPQVKEVLRRISSGQAEEWVRRASALPTTEEVRAWVARHLDFDKSAASAPEARVAMGRTG
ncbi:MAG: phosphoenolpyruvate--protein phosphotransferase [Candidatus Tectomicrobia bacterium]|nr:phosphoenolpyruvate--protein phosphotransferase [Candidatus Tectomicrobia bacterium]